MGVEGEEAAHAPGAASAGRGARLRALPRRLRSALLDDSTVLFWLLTVNCVVILGGAALWAWWGHATPAASTAAGVLLAFVGVLLPLIRRSDDAAPRLWAPVSLLAVPLSVVLVGTGALVAWSIAGAAPRDITGQVRLEGAEGMADGDEAAVALPRSAPSDHLTITFRVRDHDPDQPTCVPGSAVTVTPDTVSGTLDSLRAHSGEPLDVVAGSRLSGARLAVRLAAEPGCVLDLSVAEAAWHD